MLINEPTLEPGLFRLPDANVDRRIFIPGFRRAKHIRGAFGWFTAGWIERLAPGLAIYLNRNQTECIDFTVAPAFFPSEKLAIERGVQMNEHQAATLIANVFTNGRAEVNPLACHALECLSWMIATKILQLRIAVPTPDSNYHPKLWLFDDGDNQVLARGSGNATGRGVAKGVEHLDVDVSWLPDSNRRVKSGEVMLNDWSQGRSDGIYRVFDLPDAIVAQIIDTAPIKPPQPSDYDNIARPNRTQLHDIKNDIEIPQYRLRIPSDLNWTKGRYAHQSEAVKGWEGGNQPENGIITMATGAGKTLTSLICATRCQDRLNKKSFLIVISAPSIPLIMQWRAEVEKFGVIPIVPSLTNDTAESLTLLFRGLRSGGTHVAIVTNKLLCSPKFQTTVKEKIRNLTDSTSTMLIADEAHTLGAESFIRNTPLFFEKRLALSATPERQYDPDGTEKIFNYFGSTVYEFGLDKAIDFCLVPYRYYVHTCTLNDSELNKLKRLSQQIGVAMASGLSENETELQSLLIARRRIIETAQNKIRLLREVLIRRSPRHLEQSLIYASAKNPKQFDEIATLLNDLGLKWAAVTQETTKKPKLLKRILNSFANGDNQVLLAKKVLDEGVDIPSIREAFIVASSTVEREWIQRRGRVLRKHPNKPWAIVHDFLALPPVQFVSQSPNKSLKKIVRTEFERTYAFGRFAQNLTGKNGVNEELKQLNAAFWPRNYLAPKILNGPNEYVVAAGTPNEKPW